MIRLVLKLLMFLVAWSTVCVAGESEDVIKRHVSVFIEGQSNGQAYKAASDFLLKGPKNERISEIIINKCNEIDCDRFSFVEVLVKHGGNNAVSFLMRIHSEGVRTINSEKSGGRLETTAWGGLPQVAYALVRLGEEQYIEEVYSATKYRDKMDRGAAAYILGSVDTEKSRLCLKEIIENDSMDLPRVYSVSSLLKLDGKEKTVEFLKDSLVRKKLYKEWFDHFFPDLGIE